MNIYISTGKGYGKTPLSAFDFALKDAGVYNYNIIGLSSIIPVDSTIKIEKFHGSEEEYGHRLYVVKAEKRSRESGKFVGAAIGWYQLPDGRGVFVEHEEIGETQSAVESDLREDVKNSLSDLCQARDYKVDENSFHMEMSIVPVTNSPACALVLAVYRAEEW